MPVGTCLRGRESEGVLQQQQKTYGGQVGGVGGWGLVNRIQRVCVLLKLACKWFSLRA